MTRREILLVIFVSMACFFLSAKCSSDEDVDKDTTNDSDSVAEEGNGDTGNKAEDTEKKEDETDTVDGQDSAAETEFESGVTLPSAWPDGKYISIDEVYLRWQLKDSEALFLNVVDEEFYNLGHIEGSLKIPWDELEDNLDKVDSGKHIVIYCRRGVRSESAYTTLSEKGYPYIWVMEGGLEDWIAREYPTSPEK